ncbi:MAG: hypothetical protein H6Q60_784 [Oscillospiraceae bacterium]|nr:hypothetical protein [Oscillospiraceae bacterium]
MGVCTRCGHELAGQKFCPECGTKAEGEALDSLTEESHRFVPKKRKKAPMIIAGVVAFIIIVGVISSLTNTDHTNAAVNGASSDDAADVTSATDASGASDSKIKSLAIGDVITTDDMEITLNSVKLSYDVLPDDTSSFYTHYQADSGNVYIDVDVDVKNLQKQDLPCDDVMKVTADYNNGYEYSAFPIVEDSSMGFTYSNITDIQPLETLGMRYLISCPEEVETSSNPLIVYFKIDNEQFSYTVR